MTHNAEHIPNQLAKDLRWLRRQVQGERIFDALQTMANRSADMSGDGASTALKLAYKEGQRSLINHLLSLSNG